MKMESTTIKQYIQNGNVTVEKSITKKQGDNYVKVNIGLTVPIDDASNRDTDFKKQFSKNIRIAISRVSALVDDALDTELEELL